MSQERLKFLRIVVPGILIFFFCIPLFQTHLDLISAVQDVSLSDFSIYFVLVCALGGLYYVANLRGIFLKKSLEQVQSNIKMKLLDPFENDQAIMSAKDRLMSGRILMHIFYDLVDHNVSLKEKAKNVYFNGIFLSTAADLRALSAIFAVVYVLGWLFIDRPHYIEVAVVLSILYLLATYALLPRATILHIQLSDEQLEYIQHNLSKELHELMQRNIPSGDKE